MSYGVGKRDNAEDAICGALAKAGCDIVYANRKPWDIMVGRAAYRRGYDKGYEDGRIDAGEHGLGWAFLLIGLGVLVTLWWREIALGARWLWLQL